MAEILIWTLLILVLIASVASLLLLLFLFPLELRKRVDEWRPLGKVIEALPSSQEQPAKGAASKLPSKGVAILIEQVITFSLWILLTAMGIVLVLWGGGMCLQSSDRCNPLPIVAGAISSVIPATLFLGFKLLSDKLTSIEETSNKATALTETLECLASKTDIAEISDKVTAMAETLEQLAAKTDK